MKQFIIAIIFFLSNLWICGQTQNDHAQRGIDYYNKGEFKNAITSFTMAIEEDDDKYELYFFRGKSKFEIKDYYGAIKDLKACFYLDPADERYLSLGFYLIGIAYSNIGKYKLAVSHLDSAIIFNPDFIHDLYFERAKAYINLGEIESGCEDFSKAGSLGRSDAYDYIEKYCIGTLTTHDEKDWIKYSETLYFNFYYNPDIKKISPGIFNIVIKEIVKDEKYDEAKRMAFKDEAESKYKDMQYIIINYSVDTILGKLRKNSATVYSRNGTQIEQHNFDKVFEYLETDGWEKPSMQSIDNNLLQVVRIFAENRE